MRKKGHGWILRELSGDRWAKFSQGDAMDIDVKREVSKTATLVPGSIVQPKHTVDFKLENMAFSQGGHWHLKLNKVKLPDGSFTAVCINVNGQRRATRRYVFPQRSKNLSQ